MKKATGIFAVFFLLSPLVHAAAVKQTTSQEGINPALIYHNYCSVCHGENGDGRANAMQQLNPPARNFTSEKSHRELDRARVLKALKEGRPGTAMTAWTEILNEAEVNALADYLMDEFINPPEDSIRAMGRKLFAENCSVCHGDSGTTGKWTTGLAKTPLNFSSARGKTLSREMMIAAVTNGRPGTPMVSYSRKLTPEQIEIIVDYIRSSFMGINESVEGISGTYAGGLKGGQKKVFAGDIDAPMPMRLVGDREWGEKFFMKNCFTCHGKLGDGKGPRAYFIRPVPANFLSDKYRNSMNRASLFKAIRDGSPSTEMPAWGKVLSDQQLANVTEFVFSEFIRVKEDDEVQEKSQKKSQ